MNGLKNELVKDVTEPELIMYVPENMTNMSAIIVIPSGAFKRQMLNHEGRDGWSATK